MPFSLKEIVSGAGLPDGEYIVKFDDISSELYTPKSGKETKPRVKAKGTVMQGELMNRKLFKDWYLTPTAIGFLKTDLLGAGLPEDFEFFSNPYEDWKGFTKELRGIFLGGRLFVVKAQVKKGTGGYSDKTEYTVTSTYGAADDEGPGEAVEDEQYDDEDSSYDNV